MLDRYIETLTKEASSKEVSHEHLKTASVEDLAKMAGVTLPEGMCPKCMSSMEKTGSIYRCSCGMMKKASKMSLKRREGLSSKQFAVPKAKAKKIGVAGEIKGESKGKYPIPDKAHARNALSRVSAFGTSAEKSAVRSKVHAKFPDIGKDKKASSKCGECGMEKTETEDGVKCGCGVKVGSDESKLAMALVKLALGEPEIIPKGMLPGIGETAEGAAKRVGPGARTANILNKLRGAARVAGPLAGKAALVASPFAAMGAMGSRGGMMRNKLDPTAGSYARGALGGITGGLKGLAAGGAIGGATALPLVAAFGRRALPMLGTHALIGGGIGALAGSARGGVEAGAAHAKGIKKERKKEEAAKAKDEGKETTAAVIKVAQLAGEMGYDMEKVAAYLEAEGMDKEAIGALLRTGKALFGAGKAALKGDKALAGTFLTGAKNTAMKGAKNVGATFQTGREGIRQVGNKITSGNRGGILGGVEAVARKHPGVAAAAAAPLAYGGYKAVTASAHNVDDEMLESCEQAGRMLAKHAVGIPIDELRESVEEAKAREDIPGRAQRWQVGGGIGGGVAGMVPGALMAALTKHKAIGAGLGLAGGAAGAYAGQHLGKAHGAEEAAADKAVSLLRALRAHRAGQETGYGAGLQQGYSYGRGFGGQGEAG